MFFGILLLIRNKFYEIPPPQGYVSILFFYKLLIIAPTSLKPNQYIFRHIETKFYLQRGWRGR